MKPIVLFFFVSMVFVACKKEELPISDSSPTSQTETYNSVKIIFETNCLGCHSMSQNSYIPDYTSYNNIKQYLDQPNNTFVERLNSEDEFFRMPPSGSMSESEINTLTTWINDGYPE